MKSFDFRAWLGRNDLTAAQYARLSGLAPNTIHRRSRGEIQVPPEVARLLTALEQRGRVEDLLSTAAYVAEASERPAVEAAP